MEPWIFLCLVEWTTSNNLHSIEIKACSVVWCVEFLKVHWVKSPACWRCCRINLCFSFFLLLQVQQGSPSSVNSANAEHLACSLKSTPLHMLHKATQVRHRISHIKQVVCKGVIFQSAFFDGFICDMTDTDWCAINITTVSVLTLPRSLTLQ